MPDATDLYYACARATPLAARDTTPARPHRDERRRVPRGRVDRAAAIGVAIPVAILAYLALARRSPR